MRNKLEIFFLLISFPILCNVELVEAQNIGINDSTYYHNLSFNIMGGVNYAPVAKITPNHTVVEQNGEVFHRVCDLQIGLGTQFSLGVAYQLNRKLSLQSSVGYLRNKMRLDYQQIKFDELLIFNSSRKGSFEQDQFYIKVPLILAYTLGTKVKWQLGLGGYWLHTRGVFGNWVNFRVDGGTRVETCETPLMPEDHQGGEDTVLPWEMNNVGGILHTRISIPIYWNLEVLLQGQYFNDLTTLSPPSISKRQFLLETGFRFRLKYN